MKKKLKFIKAQNFKIPSTDGKIFELNKIKNKYILIYFYPKDDTPGCTIETNDFNSLLPKFKKLDCLVIGISKDNIEIVDSVYDGFTNLDIVRACSIRIHDHESVLHHVRMANVNDV